MSTRWIVERAPGVDKSMMADFKSGRITHDDINVLKSWTEQVEKFGPDSLRQVWVKSDFLKDKVLHRSVSIKNFWNDHDLDGAFKGCRSSSFSRLGRIIYKIVDGKIHVVRVLKITPDHKY